LANSGFSNFKDLNICFIAGTLGKGGAEKQAYYLLELLSNAGANVMVISLTKGEYWEPHLKALNIPVIWVGQAKSKFGRLWKIVKTLRKNKNFTIIQGLHYHCSPYIAITGKLLGRKTIGAIRNEGKQELSRIDPVSLFVSLRLIDLFAANSRQAINNLSSHPVLKNKLFYLPNIIKNDFPQIKDQFEDLTNKDPITILTIGRLGPQKRIDRFLRIIRGLYQCGWPVKGIVIGKGPDELHLKELAKESGVNDHISFEGEIPEVSSYYEQADLFFLTSDYEGTPNVIMEAMAFGVPIVATHVGEVSNMISNHKSGILVQPQNELDFVDRAEELIKDSMKRDKMVKAAFDYLKANHSDKVLQDSLLNLYSKLFIKS
jgi:glycosyltransferase involved in cell wall biosynthesis